MKLFQNITKFIECNQVKDWLDLETSDLLGIPHFLSFLNDQRVDNAVDGQCKNEDQVPFAL